jgi:large subunit ribosomal protein L3
MKFILGKKIGMTQIFKENGSTAPVTLVEVGPCFVTQIKTKEKDGYESLQIGYQKIEKEKKIKKPMKGKEFRFIKEFKSENSEYKVGDKIDLSIFKEGDKVDVSSTSKGKGFQGAVKRWGFHGRNSSHGAKHEERKVGSIGSSWPEHVIKGRKMPGRMGRERVTVKNLKILKIDQENGLIAIKGAIPGNNGGLIEVKGK